MNQFTEPRDAPGETLDSKDATPPASDRRPVIDTGNVLTIIGTISSQIVLITALFYYFGWVYAHSYFAYFGIDVALVGYSTADYVLRSINVAYFPFIYVVFAVLALLGLHRLVLTPMLTSALPATSPSPNTFRGANGMSPARPVAVSTVDWARRFSRWRQERAETWWIVDAIQIIAIILVAVVFAGVLLPDQFGIRMGLVLPLLLMFGTSVLGYVAHLRSRRPDKFPVATLVLPATPSRVYILTLLALGLLGGLWAVSLYGNRVGTSRAAEFAHQLQDQPGVTVYSTERLALNGPGITIAEIPQPAKYHYQYTGLRLLIRAPDKFLLMPAKWQHGRDRIFLLRDDNSIRIDITAW